MGWTAASANLGCGGPHSKAMVLAARLWAREAAESAIDILFLQESPPSLGDDLGSAYVCFAHPPDSPTYSCRSLVAIRWDSGIEAEPLALRTAAYHGSYLAAASVRLPRFGPATFVSVHASPAKLESRYRKLWPGELPTPRAVAKGVLWDADLVAATLSDLAGEGPLLAAGDFNEARESDPHFGGPWGVQYFAGLAEGGLVDCTYGRWGDSERPTRGPFQDDHILATPDIDGLISDPAVIDVSRGPGGSDHAPLRWTLAV